MQEPTKANPHDPKATPWTESEGLSVIEDWRQSGQSQTKFCRVRGIPPHRLRYWIDRAERKCADRSERPDFVVVPIAEEEPKPQAVPSNSSSHPIEISIGAQVVLRISAEAGHATLVKALRAIMAVVA